MINTLLQSLQELESQLPQADHLALEVSQVSLGWHLAHSIKVVTGITKSLRESNPAPLSPTGIPNRRIATLQHLPRGRAQAPKVALPKPEELETIALTAKFQQAYQALTQLQTLPEQAHFNHPAFGVLYKEDAIKFLTLHTVHHLEITRDILKMV